MKRTILFLSLCTLFTAPAFAQDSSIRVIHDDGTVDEVEIPGWGAPAKPASAPEEKTPAAASDLATMPPAAVTRARAKEEAEKAAADEAERYQQAPAEVSPVDAAIAKAVDEADAPKSEPGKETKSEKPASKKAAKKSMSQKSIPKPAKKNAPSAEEQERMEAGLSRYPAAPNVPGKDLDARPPLDIPPGTEITPQVAKMIALDYAPPSRGIEVLPRVHNDKPVYVVRFRTDDGLKDVLIDRETGQPIWD